MDSKTNKEEMEETQNKDVVQKFKIDHLINSVFKDKSKKPEIIQN